MASTCLSSTQFFIQLSNFQKSKSNSTRNTGTITCAARREAHNRDFSGRLVDENLIILRKRINEMKLMESNYELPREWMKWEKEFYASYDSIICDAMGHLQACLMETRPGLALGVFAIIALSVPTSTAVVMYNLFQLSQGVLTGIHLG